MNAVRFIKEVREEVRKVTWPTRAETFKNAILVLVASFAVAIYLGAVDYIISNVLERII